MPCLTLRKNTERPITCELGSNRLVGTDPGGIIAAFHHELANGHTPSRIPPFWDGQAAGRIARIILDRYA